MRLLDFIIGDKYQRYLSKRVIMILFVLKRVLVYRLGVRALLRLWKCSWC